MTIFLYKLKSNTINLQNKNTNLWQQDNRSRRGKKGLASHRAAKGGEAPEGAHGEQREQRPWGWAPQPLGAGFNLKGVLTYQVHQGFWGHMGTHPLFGLRVSPVFYYYKKSDRETSGARPWSRRCRRKETANGKNPAGGPSLEGWLLHTNVAWKPLGGPFDHSNFSCLYHGVTPQKKKIKKERFKIFFWPN